MIDSIRAPKGFVIQKVSEFGASNQNIARVMLQCIELVKVSSLAKRDQETLLLAAHDLSQRLANAESSAHDLRNRSEALYASLKAQHEGSPDEAMEIPYIPGLQIIFEGYFYNAKNIIRDLGGAPCKILLGKAFANASEWASFDNKKEAEIAKYLRRREKEHPGFSTIRELIHKFRENILRIVAIRNALEHPGGNSGTVRVNNWQATGTGLTPPIYALEKPDSGPFDLSDTLVAFHLVLLELVETIVVFGMMFHLPDGLGVYSLPEKDRNPDAPVRYRVIRITEEMKVGSSPFTGKDP